MADWKTDQNGKQVMTRCSNCGYKTWPDNKTPYCPGCGSRMEDTDLPAGNFEWFVCGCRSVIWDNDFDTEDYGYEPGGIVHDLHCSNCGSSIQYIERFDEDDES